MKAHSEESFSRSTRSREAGDLYSSSSESSSESGKHHKEYLRSSSSSSSSSSTLIHKPVPSLPTAPIVPSTPIVPPAPVIMPAPIIVPAPVVVPEPVIVPAPVVVPEPVILPEAPVIPQMPPEPSGPVIVTPVIQTAPTMPLIPIVPIVPAPVIPAIPVASPQRNPKTFHVPHIIRGYCIDGISNFSEDSNKGYYLDIYDGSVYKWDYEELKQVYPKHKFSTYCYLCDNGILYIIHMVKDEIVVDIYASLNESIPGDVIVDKRNGNKLKLSDHGVWN